MEITLKITKSEMQELEDSFDKAAANNQKLFFWNGMIYEIDDACQIVNGFLGSDDLVITYTLKSGEEGVHDLIN